MIDCAREMTWKTCKCKYGSFELLLFWFKLGILVQSFWVGMQFSNSKSAEFRWKTGLHPSQPSADTCLGTVKWIRIASMASSELKSCIKTKSAIRTANTLTWMWNPQCHTDRCVYFMTLSLASYMMAVPCSCLCCLILVYCVVQCL